MDAGASVNAADDNGKTALMHAADGYGENTAAAIPLLLRAGANIRAADTSGRTALTHAAGSESADAIALLLEHEENIATACDAQGRSPLKIALRHDRSNILKVFLDKGLDANTRDASGTPLLAIAAREGAVDCLRLLLAHGAQLDATDAHGRAALEHAEEYGRDATADILRRATATNGS